MLRPLLVLLLGLLCARADEAIELARMHLAVIGGKERVEALHSLRAVTRVTAGDKYLEVILLARAPRSIRTEARYGDVLIIQGYDGGARPWQARRGADASPRQPLPDEAAAAFVADADFLDPLADWVNRGSSLEYVDSTLSDSGVVRRIRVATPGRDLVEVWVDSKTYLIVRQLRLRRLKDGQELVIETRFGDFRAVAGLILPHLISNYADGRLLHTTEVLSITPNPQLPPNCFAEP